MWICYLIATIPLVVGLAFWLASKKITLGEWALSFGIGILTTIIVHAISIAGMTSDVETWSGQVDKAVYSPAWVEEYEVAIYKTVTRTRTNSKGETETYEEEEFSHYETRYRDHPDEWTSGDTLGQSFDIDARTYAEIKSKFGEETSRDDLKSGFYSGNKKTFFAINENGYVYPTTATRRWSNRVKACPSVFSFAKVPEGTQVFEYPVPSDGWRDSNRLLGSAAGSVPIKAWDQLNSRLGPMKKVNLIASGLGQDSMLGQWQEAKWTGGKKNDLVISFGGDPKKPDWVHVFGWSESFQAKRQIEGIVGEKGFVPEALPLIEEEIMTGYMIKDWSKFDYLTIDPPSWAYMVQVIVMLLTQGGVWAWALGNDFEKRS